MASITKTAQDTLKYCRIKCLKIKPGLEFLSAKLTVNYAAKINCIYAEWKLHSSNFMKYVKSF